jgi:hypothetical protein
MFIVYSSLYVQVQLYSLEEVHVLLSNTNAREFLKTFYCSIVYSTQEYLIGVYKRLFVGHNSTINEGTTGSGCTKN